MPTGLAARPRPPGSLVWLLGGGIVLVLAVICLPMVLEATRVVVGANFHVVRKGEIYRSAQLSDAKFRDVIQQHGIRTVINLRGCCPQFQWYQRECRTLDQLGVTRCDIMFSSYLVPGVEEFRELVRVLDRCEYPVLLHCRRGADRTGLASAVALLLHTDAEPEETRRQLSWRFGHLSFGRSGGLHLVLDMYKAWLAQDGKLHRPELFRTWVLEYYQPGPFWAEIEPLQVPTRLQVKKPVAARFRIHNRSHFPWQLRQAANVGMHLHWLVRNEDHSNAWQGGAGYFDAVVLSGESIELTIGLPSISKPGKYELLVDMGDEVHGWFFLVGSKPFVTELIVEDS